MKPGNEKPLRVALIGMSGAGKSYWTKRLATKYPVVSCDDLIEQHLAPTLQAGDFKGISGLAAWMGWPDSPTYAQRESEYLSAEIASLDEVLSKLEKDPQANMVLDTTGSVIHTGNHLLYRLRKLMTVVYLAISAEEQQILIQRYLNDPKPVLWQGTFQPRPGESPVQTVARCYPALIAARRQSYEALAHCTIPVKQLREDAERSHANGNGEREIFIEKIHAILEQRA